MPKILPLLRLPLLAVLALSPTGCHNARVEPAPPPAERFERVNVERPRGEARCDDDGDGEFEPCLSQRQADTLFNDVVDALCEANDQLAWLSDYYLRTELGPSC